MENGNGVEERENPEDLVPGALPICGPTTRLDEESPSTMNKDALKNSNSVIKRKGGEKCFTEENGVVRETSDENRTQNEDKIPTGLRQGVNSGYPTEETGKIGTYNFSSVAALFAPQNTMTEYQKSVWPRLKNEDPQHINGVGVFIHYLAKLRALPPINGSKSVSTRNGRQSPRPQIPVPEQEPLPQSSKQKSGDDDTIDDQSPRKKLKLSQGPSTATSVTGFGPSLTVPKYSKAKDAGFEKRDEEVEVNGEQIPGGKIKTKENSTKI